MIHDYVIKVNDDVRDATGGLPLLEKPRELVRCKDCTNGVIYCDNGDIVCDHVDSNGNDTHPADWFCADGERKDGEQG